MDARTRKVLDKVCPGAAGEVYAKLGYLSEWTAPTINVMNGALCKIFEVPSDEWKLVQPNQGTIVE